MSDAAVQSSATPAQPAKLDELMLAMDVVDTLRHRDAVVDRELDEDKREAQLIDQMKALYKSQGIEVSDRVIQEGVKALKESRFVYIPPKRSLGRSLANLWVKRATIGNWIVSAASAVGIGLAVYQFGFAMPARNAAEKARIELTETLPRALEAANKEVLAEAQADDARKRAATLLAAGKAALERGKADDAREALADMDRMTAALRQEYTLRIAGRPDDQTGFFRENGRLPTGRGYYVVVQAEDPNGKPVTLPVRNEETDKTAAVSRFAVRVPLETYNAVRQDKARNGIVQNAQLAKKQRGYLTPDYLMPVQDGRLTEWN